jgi:hypothetical protein
MFVMFVVTFRGLIMAAIPVTCQQLKDFASKHFNIPKSKLLAQSRASHCTIRIKPDSAPESRDLVYSHKFPPEFGNRCMRLVYAGHEPLMSQDWGGNITDTSVTLTPVEWHRVFASYE